MYYYLFNFQKKEFYFSQNLVLKNLTYKDFDYKSVNAKLDAKGDSIDYCKFESKIFWNSSFNSWIESMNYSKQIDLYIMGENTDLPDWNNAIKNY